MSKQWGAPPECWDHFDLVLGLTEDLLPVVSNLEATIDPKSKMKELGKTPSRYNAQRNAVGIPEWTTKRSTIKDVQRWQKEPDYGICIQTRLVRALDIDVPDRDRSDRIARGIAARVGALPKRYRADSGKQLLVFELEGDHPKRSFPVDGGVIEFLGTGNQFVACGTHPSGSRYEWVGDLPYEIPRLEREEFEALWAALVAEFAIEAPTAGTLSVRQRGQRIDLADPVADYLREHGRVLGEQRDGSLIVACPWESSHSTGERGNGSTVWFPAGTNGYPKGHFRCLHAHCTGRSDGEFYEAIGYVEDVSGEFEAIEPAKAEPKRWPSLSRQENGAIHAIVENVAKMVRRPDICGIEIRFDTFRDEIVFSRGEGLGQWQPFLDQHYVELRITLEHLGFKPIGRELMRDVVHLVATENVFDTAIEWLSTLEWDGIPRIDGFLERYFGADPGPYSDALSAYWWTAAAGRVMSPGIKADMCVVLIGDQGIKKSTAIAATVPSDEFFVEMSFHEKEDDLARKMRGRLIAEISELRGLHTRELESIKAFMTRTHEKWVPKYREFAVAFPRRLVFVGTSNQTQFLADSTGNRRWLPVEVQHADVDAIRRDRLQLWAEARLRFELNGVEWEHAERLAGRVHNDHMIEDAWLDPVGTWLDSPDVLTGEIPRTRKFLRIGDVLSGALRIDLRNSGRLEQYRIGAILRTFGYERKKVRDGSKTFWAMVPRVPFEQGEHAVEEEQGESLI